MEMPYLRPIPIKTKDQNILIRIWRWITSIRKWELIEDWEYDLPNGPRIIVPKGFIFDGASIPRPLWAILSPVGLLLTPGLIHDFAYRYNYLWAYGPNGKIYKYEKGRGQWFWDRVFRKVGVDVNGLAVIDMLAWLMLATFGWWAWLSNRARNAAEIFPSRIKKYKNC